MAVATVAALTDLATTAVNLVISAETAPSPELSEVEVEVVTPPAVEAATIAALVII